MSLCLISLAKELRSHRIDAALSTEDYKYQIYVAILQYVDKARDEMFKRGGSLGEVDAERLTKVMTKLVAMEEWNELEASKALYLDLDRELLDMTIPRHR